MSLLTRSDLKHALLSRHTPFQSLHTCMPQLTQHHAVNLALHYSVGLPSEGGKKKHQDFKSMLLHTKAGTRKPPMI